MSRPESRTTSIAASLLCILLMFLEKQRVFASVHVSTTLGDDTSGDGSSASPFFTLEKALDWLDSNSSEICEIVLDAGTEPHIISASHQTPPSCQYFSLVGNSSQVSCNCSSTSTSCGLVISNTPSVSINGLAFRGCKPAVSATGLTSLSIRNSSFEKNIAESNQLFGAAIRIISEGASVEVLDSSFVSNEGTALFVESVSSLTVDTCSFNGNQGNLSGSLGIGGGLYCSSCTSVDVIGSIFLRNNATNGGAAYIAYATNVTVSNSTFFENLVTGNMRRSDGLGAGIFMKFCAEVLVTNTTFEGNLASFAGGGGYIAQGSELTVVGCLFLDNDAIANRTTGYSAAGYGGGLSVSGYTQAQLVGSNFTGNSAITFGGGMYATETNVTLDRCLFSENVVNGTLVQGRYGGGGLFVSSATSTSVTGSDFIQNSLVQDAVNSYGGGIYALKILSIFLSDCSFTSNYLFTSKAFGAGFAFAQCDSVSVDDVTVLGNVANGTAAIFGAAAYILESTVSVTILRGLFSENAAVSTISYGGGLFLDTCSDSLLEDTRFDWNEASSEGYKPGGASGVGMFATDCENITMNRCVFERNIANVINNAAGAGLYIDGCLNFLVESCSFLNNRARQGSGARVNGGESESNLVVIDSVFDGNFAASTGGGLSATNWKEAVIQNVSFSGNEAQRAGGAYFSGGDMCVTLVVTNVTFTGNSATGSGAGIGAGGLLAASCVEVVMESVLFKKNAAYGLGGGAIVSDANITIDTCLFEGNVARYAGGIRIDQALTAVVTNTTFSNNGATLYEGGGMSITGVVTVTVTDSSVVTNSAGFGGGLFVSNSSAVILFRSRFERNSADLVVGGVLVQSDDDTLTADVTIDTCVFIGNYGSTSGGGLSVWRGGSVGITNSTFRSNEVVLRGGGAYLDADVVHVAQTGFDSNVAGADGAALWCNGTAELRSFNASGNSGGTVVFLRSQAANGSLEVRDVTLISNAATATLLQFETDTHVEVNGAAFTSNVGTVMTISSVTKASSLHIRIDDVTIVSNSGTYLGSTVLTTCPADLSISNYTTACSAVLFYNRTSPTDCPYLTTWCQEAYSNSNSNTRCVFPPTQLSIKNVSSTYQSGDILSLSIERLDSDNMHVAFDPSASSSISVSFVAPTDLLDWSYSTDQCGTFNLVGMVSSRNSTPVTSHSIQLGDLASPISFAIRPCPTGWTPALDTYAFACRRCPQSLYSIATEPDFTTQCLVCPSHASCPGGDAVLAEAGHWRSDLTQGVEVLECPREENCHDGGCAPGYTGPLCGVCSPGYGASLGFTCVRCDSFLGRRWAGALLFLLAALAVCVVANLSVATDSEPDPEVASPAAAGGSYVPIVKLVVAHVQSLSLAQSLRFPGVGISIVSRQLIAATVLANPAILPSWDCMFELSSSPYPYFIRVAIFMAMPPVFAVISAIFSPIVLWIVSSRSRRRGLRTLYTSADYVAYFIVALFVVLPYVFAALFGMLSRIEVSQGIWHLRAQLNIDINSAEYKSWLFGLAVPGIVIYCAVLPAGLFTVMLYGARNGGLKEESFRSKFGFLYSDYREGLHWWSIVTFFQQMLFGFASMSLFPWPILQGLVFLSVAFLSAVLFQKYKPLRSNQLNTLSLVGSGAVFATISAGMNATSNDLASSIWALSSIALAANLAFVALVVFVLWSTTKARYQSALTNFSEGFRYRASFLRRLKPGHNSNSSRRRKDEPTYPPLHAAFGYAPMFSQTTMLNTREVCVVLDVDGGAERRYEVTPQGSLRDRRSGRVLGQSTAEWRLGTTHDSGAGLAYSEGSHGQFYQQPELTQLVETTEEQDGSFGPSLASGENGEHQTHGAPELRKSVESSEGRQLHADPQNGSRAPTPTRSWQDGAGQADSGPGSNAFEAGPPLEDSGSAGAADPDSDSGAPVPTAQAASTSFTGGSGAV